MRIGTLSPGDRREKGDLITRVNAYITGSHNLIHRHSHRPGRSKLRLPSAATGAQVLAQPVYRAD
jgi:hypothetical protein